MSRLRKFIQLPAADRALLVEAALTLLGVRLALTLLPFRALRRQFEGETDAASGREAIPDRLTWALATAARHTPGAHSCLVRAVTARLLLARRGVRARVRLGVGRGEDDRFVAHAWLESGNRVLVGGSSQERYTPLPLLRDVKS